MQTYTVLIIDDEKLARDSIKVLLQDIGIWKVLGEAIDGREAIRMIDQFKPDLVFLDIDMPQASGIDVIQRLKHKPYIVFTTAYDTYALKAFEENAIDYLLKPYTDKRFYQALDRVKLKIEEHQSAQKVESILQLLHQGEKSVENPERKIPIRTNDRILLLDVRDVLWVNASGNYVELFTDSAKYLHYSSMNNMEKLLAEPNFIRIHRSYIVRRNQIISIRKLDEGEYVAVLKNNIELKVSRSNWEKIKSIVGSS